MKRKKKEKRSRGEEEEEEKGRRREGVCKVQRGFGSSNSAPLAYLVVATGTRCRRPSAMSPKIYV